MKAPFACLAGEYVYHPVGKKLIWDKSRGESQLVRMRGVTGKGAFISRRPQRIELKSVDPINAYLVDCAHLSSDDLVALQMSPGPQQGDLKPKTLTEYPKLCKSSGQTQIDWHLPSTYWPWSRAIYQLVVECPENPHATIDIWVDYGGQDWDESH